MALSAAPGSYLATLERMHREAIDDPGRIVLVAERGGEVVAMAHLAPSLAANGTHRAEVQRVAVAADARGTGVGRRGVMPNYSRRPDGTLWPGAFYFKDLSA